MWTEKINQILDTGLSQHEVAERLKISQAHVSDIASGKRGKRPSFDLCNAINKLHSRVTKKKAA